MVDVPDRYLEAAADAGADVLTVHVEACRHLYRTLSRIRQTGKKVCVALNPATPLSVLDYILEDLDMVLLMTVEPGFGGQAYIPAMTSKIRRLRHMITQSGRKISIEVDGGINRQNAGEALDAGADVLVAGSAVFGPDSERKIKEFHAMIRKRAGSSGGSSVAPFLGRLDDISVPGMDLIRTIAGIFRNYDIQTEIIAASIRNPVHVIDCALAGADIATVPYSVLEQMTRHPLTDAGIEKFIADSMK